MPTLHQLDHSYPLTFHLDRVVTLGTDTRMLEPHFGAWELVLQKMQRLHCDRGCLFTILHCQIFRPVPFEAVACVPVLLMSLVGTVDDCIVRTLKSHGPESSCTKSGTKSRNDVAKNRSTLLSRCQSSPPSKCFAMMLYACGSDVLIVPAVSCVWCHYSLYVCICATSIPSSGSRHLGEFT